MLINHVKLHKIINQKKITDKTIHYNRPDLTILEKVNKKTEINWQCQVDKAMIITPSCLELFSPEDCKKESKP